MGIRSSFSTNPALHGQMGRSVLYSTFVRLISAFPIHSPESRYPRQKNLVTHLWNCLLPKKQPGGQADGTRAIRRSASTVFLAIFMFAHRRGISSNDGMCMINNADDNGIDDHHPSHRTSYDGPNTSSRIGSSSRFYLFAP